MLYVWLVVLAMVLGIFALVAITGRGMVTIDDPEQLGGGPWWAWMLGVILLLFVFVIVYMISIQYAEPVLMYKISRDEEEGLPLKKTGGAHA
jgi:amino acid transporter